MCETKHPDRPAAEDEAPARRDRGCAEYHKLSRRRFLGLGAGALFAAAAPGWLPRVVLADEHQSGRDVIISIFLRGGCDSLSMCVPHGEANYYRLRPNLAIPRPDAGAGAALDLDGFFGFSPPMAPLLAPYNDDKLLVVHATGLTHGTRSHFNAMHYMEVGQAEPPVSMITGWLGRHLATTAPTLDNAVLRAVGIGFGLPRTLVGGPATLPIDNLAEFGFQGIPATEVERREALEAMYRHADDLLEASAGNTLRTVDLLERIDFEGYRPGGDAVYPETEFGTALESTAALIKAEVGVEAVSIDYGGWDTHDFQGPLEGNMAQLMTGLSEGLAALYEDLLVQGSAKVTVVVMSEFGRNAAENASFGTDHGHGNMMLVLGNDIAGGRVLSQWPGLEREQLFEGQDLAITTDYRDVLTEIATKRLGNVDYRNVFPDPSYVPTDYGVTT